MTRLIHLTDLHFGLHRPELVAPLRLAILANSPDVVVVSGDLTQRALRAQFREGMAFVRSLGVPFVMVPGNHDLPVYNPFARLFNPFGAYRTGAMRDLTPTLQIGHLRLFGANTADPFSWRGGVTRRAEIDKICQLLNDGPPDVTNILVCHHPLVEPPGFQRGETRGADASMTRLAGAGLHVVLSGHLHHWTAGLGIRDQTPSPIFHMQTGTALCSRMGERDHGFAVMDFAGEGLTVTPWLANDTTLQFQPRQGSGFSRRQGHWQVGG